MQNVGIVMLTISYGKFRRGSYLTTAFFISYILRKEKYCAVFTELYYTHLT